MAPRHQDDAGQPEPRRSVLRRSTRRRRCWPSWWSWAPWARRPAPASTRRSASDILRFDLASGDYVPGGGKADEVVARMLKKPAAERLKLLRESTKAAGAVPVGDPARQLPLRRRAPGRSIADNARDVDFAMRWGFGWKQGPFELWQAAGWQQVAAVGQGRHRRRQGAVATRRCRRGCSKARSPKPAACTRPKARGAPSQNKFVPRASCRSTDASCSARRVLRRGRADAQHGRHHDVHEDEVRVWTLDERGADRQHHRPRCT